MGFRIGLRAGARTMEVRDRMTTGFVRARPTDSLVDAVRAMEGEAVHYVLVYDADHLVGLVSDRDLRFVQSEADTNQGSSAHTVWRSMTVAQAMTADVTTIAASASVAEAAAVMLDRHIGALPVAENGDVIGIISDRDLLEVTAGRDREAYQPLRLQHGAAMGPPSYERLRRCRHAAVVGLSADSGATPALETAKLMSLGMTVYPVHPTQDALLGVRCYRSIAAIPGPVDIVQVFPSPDVKLSELADGAIRKGAKIFWYQGTELSPEVGTLLREKGIAVVCGVSLHGEYVKLRA